MESPKFLKTNHINDIDPFTVFGMFNKHISDSNRSNLIKELANEFEINDSKHIPTSFVGIPILDNRNPTFFDLNAPSNEKINNLWDLFQNAIEYADSNEKIQLKEKFIDSYDKVANQKGIKWNITMGLYWIRPYIYINLDSRTRWFIEKYNSNLINVNIKSLENVPKGEEYLSLCNLSIHNLTIGKHEYKNLPELAYTAYTESEKVNQQMKKSNEDDSTLVDEDANITHYWLYEAGYGCDKWEEFNNKGIMAIEFGEIGDLSNHNDKRQIKEAMQKAHPQSNNSFKSCAQMAWKFSKEMKIGDIIFVKKGVSTIVGRGVVDSNYFYDKRRTDNYNNIRKVKWTHKGEWDHPGDAVKKR